MNHDIRQKLGAVFYSQGNQIQQGLIVFVVIILASALSIFLVFNYYTLQAILLLAAFAILVILRKPAVGLALYIIVYPLVPAEESLSPIKFAVFGLFLLLLAIWLLNKSIQRGKLFTRPEYRWLYIFFLFLCLSPLLGTVNSFSVIDWIRDIAPLLNLLLIPIMVDYFSKKQKHWIPYLFFVPWVLGTIQNLFLLLEMYDFPFSNWASSLPRLMPLHPSLGVGLGLLMYLLKAPHRKFWLIFGILNLAGVFLTPGRTIWITTVTIILLIVAFSSRKKLWAISSIGVLIILMGFLFFGKGPERYIESQRQRFHQLLEYHTDLSFENRIEEIKQTGELFLSSPVYGIGFGYQYNFWRPFITGTGPGLLGTNYTHNDIMFIASKGGVIGLILFGLMLYGFYKKLLRRRKEKSGGMQSIWATIALIALINSIVIGLSTPIFQSRWAAFALAILLAMGLGYKEVETDARQA